MNFLVLYLYKSEIIIRVDKYAIVPSPDEIKNNPYNIPVSISKSIFFFIHEGIKLALNKIKSFKLQKK